MVKLMNRTVSEQKEEWVVVRYIPCPRTNLSSDDQEVFEEMDAFQANIRIVLPKDLMPHHPHRPSSHHRHPRPRPRLRPPVEPNGSLLFVVTSHSSMKSDGRDDDVSVELSLFLSLDAVDEKDSVVEKVMNWRETRWLHI